MTRAAGLPLSSKLLASEVGGGDETATDVQRQPALLRFDKRVRFELAQCDHTVFIQAGAACHELVVEPRHKRANGFVTRAIDDAQDVYRSTLRVVRALVFHQAIQTH